VGVRQAAVDSGWQMGGRGGESVNRPSRAAMLRYVPVAVMSSESVEVFSRKGFTNDTPALGGNWRPNSECQAKRLSSWEP